MTAYLLLAAVCSGHFSSPCCAIATRVLSVALIAVCGAIQGTVVQAGLTDAQLGQFRDDLTTIFINDQGGPGTSGGGPPMLRALVRLAFHDCASAKCDGCIDTMDARNNPGLGEMVEVLQPICDKYSLGKADCWAAAGSMAVEETSYNGPDLARVPLFFGRKDAPSCTGFTAQNPEAIFPSASVGYAPTMEYFKKNFNFTVNETVAILGAHSLGLASPKGSGFDGAWTIAPNTLDNTFYTDMLKGQLGWGAQLLPPPVALYQWTSVTGQQLMLNSDMCLLLDIFNETAGGTSPAPGIGAGGVSPGTSTKPLCIYDSCGEAPSAGVVRAYAADNSLFMADFIAVWVRMATKGYDICDLSVTVSEAGLPEELYRIDELTGGCTPAFPGFTGPVTTGVLGPAPPIGGGTGGSATMAPAPAADAPVLEPLAVVPAAVVPAAAVPAVAPVGAPAEAPAVVLVEGSGEGRPMDDEVPPGDVVTEEAELGPTAQVEASGATWPRANAPLSILAAAIGAAAQLLQ